MKKLLPIIVLFISFYTYAQVGINTTTPDISSMLDIASTNKGILIPRMTEAQKLLVVTPATGLLVYQTNVVAGFYYYDGTAWVLLGNTSASEIQKFGNIIRNTTDLTNDNFVIGSSSMDDIAGTNDDKRLFYNKAKAAFRVGNTTNTNWDNTNVGDNSFAAGNNTRASGFSSVALGNGSIASGGFSTALGGFTNALGGFSTAIGLLNTASGQSATAMGEGTVASGAFSTSMGTTTTAQSVSETALGQFNTDAIIPNATTFILTDRLLTVGNGTSLATKSNALTILKNGNTAIGNINPTEKFEVDGKTKTINLQVTTATAPAIGQVLTATDINGNMSWQTPVTNSSEIQKFGNIIRNTSDLTNDNFVIGSSSLDDIASVNDDKRLFFNKAKGAFRVGTATNTQWDNANIGTNSFASGLDNRASGQNSTAMGLENSASGNNATAIGFSAYATGGVAIATGYNTQAAGTTSTALGNSTLASGFGSTATGISTVASGRGSIAMGNYTEAQGLQSTAMGGYTNAYSLSETALGQYNTYAVSPSPILYVATDRLVTVGNGTDAANLSNAFTILKNGNTAIGNINPTEKLEVDGKTKTINLQVTTATAPVIGQVLTATDIVGNMSWQTPTDASEIQKFGTIIRNTTDLTNDNFVIGSISMDDIVGGNDNRRLFFNKTRGAFRAGNVTNTNWDNANIGINSFASGFNTMASGDVSTALGWTTIASGFRSTAMGNGSTASGDFSTAMGAGTTASANFSTAMGNNTIASAQFSTSNGSATTASGDYSTAMGRSTTAQSLSETVLGQFNTNAVTPNGTTFIATNRLLTIGNGISNASRSNALTILKNGNTAIGNINPTEKLEVDGKTKTINLQVTTATAPVIGQVLTATDIVGNMSWQTPIATSEIQKFGTIIRNTTDLTNDNFVIGSTSMDDIPGLNDNKRLFFDKTRGAFRVGNVTNTNWDNVNIGANSFASGFNTTASGETSTALGWAATASGNWSTSVGYETTAAGTISTAMGFDTTAVGNFSTATGVSTTASGVASITMGASTTASGNTSTAMGNITTASGAFSTAMGDTTTASGDYSTSMGKSTTAQSLSETVLGQFNTNAITPNGTTFIATNRLLTIGNGTANATRSNALTILKNGNTAIGNINPTERLEVDGKTKTIDLQVTTATAPVIGQVLTATDVLGNMSWQNPTAVTSEIQKFGNIIRNTTDLTNDNFVIGSTSMDDILLNINDNRRLFFNKTRGAFRAGSVTNTNWDNANIGMNSFASGFNTMASGHTSTAMGVSTVASASGATSMGFTTTASGNYSTAMGVSTTAQSLLETVLGQFNTDAVTPNGTVFISTDRLFTVANGTDVLAKSNALTILKNGNTAIGNINPNTKLDIDGNVALRSSGALIANITAADIARSYIRYSGTTTFNTIPNGLQQGQILIIEFTATVVVTDNIGNLRLNGNLNATIDDILQLIWNGTNWIEMQRSVN